MKYKILKRIKEGKETYGFQLLSEEGELVTLSRYETLKLAKAGLLKNANYNESNGNLLGTDRIDLRRLPTIRLEDFKWQEMIRKASSKNNTKTNGLTKSNHQLAKEYIKNQVSTGDNKLDLELLPEDGVNLIEILEENTGKIFKFPIFITDYECGKYRTIFGTTRFEKIILDKSRLRSLARLFTDCRHITHIGLRNMSGFTSMKETFSDCERLKYLYMQNFDTSNVKNMELAFYRCESLTKLDLKEFNTSKVTNMKAMFAGCSSLTTLDLGNFDTSRVGSMSLMFRNCSSLKEINLSSFDTSGVWGMTEMFKGCSSLVKLDLSNFDTYYVEGMAGMFGGCESLKELKLPNFNTHYIQAMSFMFSRCRSLVNLDLSSFTAPEVKEINLMFNECNSLVNLDLSNFDTSRLEGTLGVFKDCYSLKKVLCRTKRDAAVWYDIYKQDNRNGKAQFISVENNNSI